MTVDVGGSEEANAELSEAMSAVRAMPLRETKSVHLTLKYADIVTGPKTLTQKPAVSPKD